MVVGNRYGPGYGTIWLANVKCYGSETSISQCSHGLWGAVPPLCDHSKDVSVSCGTAPVQFGKDTNNHFSVQIILHSTSAESVYSSYMRIMHDASTWWTGRVHTEDKKPRYRREDRAMPQYISIRIKFYNGIPPFLYHSAALPHSPTSATVQILKLHTGR